MNRLARILFLVSLISAAGLAMLTFNVHAADTATAEKPRTATSGGGDSATPEPKKPLTDGVATNFDFKKWLADFSEEIRKEKEAGKEPNAIGREIEMAVGERGITEKSGTVVFVGDDRSGRSTIAKAITAKRADLQVWRLKMEALYGLNTKAEQFSIIKDVILNLEKLKADNPGVEHVLLVDNAKALNQGANVEVRPIGALTEAINFHRGIPTWIVADPDTHKAIFFENKPLLRNITVNEVRNAGFDAVVFKLRSIKEGIETKYGVIIKDSEIAEAAKIATRFYSNDPFAAGESLLVHAAHRTMEELRGNTTEAMEATAELVKLKQEKASLMRDLHNDPIGQFEDVPGETKARLEAVDAKILEVEKKTNDLTKPDPSLSAEIQQMRREIQEKKERQDELEGRRRLNPDINTEYNRLEREIEDLTTRMREKQATNQAIQDKGLAPSKRVTLRQVQVLASEWLKIPLSIFSVNVEDALNSIREIKGRVIGQDHIIEQAAITIAAKRQERKRQEANARERKEEFFSKPIWSAMLAGSTGTGKTEIAKQLAKQLGIPESDILRFDMNEFQGEHSVSRLLGAPPGYVGYDAGGALTNGVMEREYRVILFDEIEKAHPKIFEALMNMLDEGHMTDSHGRKVRFGNTIVLFTTNLGQEYTTLNRTQLFLTAKARQESAGDLDTTLEELEKMNERELRLVLFKGDARKKWGTAQAIRVDDMLMTNNHTREAIATIVRNAFKVLAKDYKDFDKVNIRITESALAQIEDSYKVTGGARIVKNAFQKMVTNPLNIMAINLKPGDAVTIDFRDGKFDYIVTTEEDYQKVVTAEKEATRDRRAAIREQIRNNPGEVGRVQREVQLSPEWLKMFDKAIQVKEAVAKALHKFRK